MPPLSKAQGFASYIHVLRAMLGDQWTDYVAQLSAPTRALIETPPLPMTWMEDKYWNEMNVRLSRTLWKETPQLFTEAARRQLHHDLSTLYKVLMHMVSPETVVRKTATLYGTYTKNGQMLARTLAPRHVEVTVKGVEDIIPELWLFHIGSITGVLECTGAKGISVTLQEGGGAASFAVYHARWTG